MSNAQSNRQELTTAERQCIDEFSRELALTLRRITGRTPDQDFDHPLPNPIPSSPSIPQEITDDKP